MRFRLALVLAATLVLGGCRARQITTLERDEAANDASDANFAVTIHDWGRAEGMYAKAVELCPDEGDVWVNLGIVRMRMHNPAGARSAYKSALSAYKADAKLNPGSSIAVIRSAYVLAVLGRADEARSVVDDAYAKAPDDRRLKAFVDAKGIDRMLADPTLKEISP